MRGRTLAKLVALGLGCVFALGVGELGARLYFKLLSGDDYRVHNTRGFGMPDPRLGYRPEPGAEVRSWGPEFDFEYAINAKGVRDDRETPYERTPGKARIVVTGDSFTFGAGVANADRYGDRLERLIAGSEVVNMGVSGWGTDQQLLFYEQEGKRYGADIVVVGYLTSHIRRNWAEARSEANLDGLVVPKPHFVLDDKGELELTNVPVGPPRPKREDERKRSAETAARRSTGIPIPFRRELRQNSALYKLVHSRLRERVHGLVEANPVAFPEYGEERPEWLLTRAILLDFARQVHEQGSEFVLMLIPNQELIYKHHLDRTPHAMLRALAQEGDFPVLDLLAAMDAAAADGEGRPYFQIDAHLSPRGHEVAARELAALIELRYAKTLSSGRSGASGERRVAAE